MLRTYQTVVNGPVEHKPFIEHCARAHNYYFNWYVIEKVKSIKNNRLSGKSVILPVTGHTMWADSMKEIASRWRPSPEFADVSPKIAQHAFREASLVLRARIARHFKKKHKGPKGFWLFRDPMQHRSFGVCGHLKLNSAWLKIQGLPRLLWDGGINAWALEQLESGSHRVSRVVLKKNIGLGPFDRGEDNQWIAQISVREVDEDAAVKSKKNKKKGSTLKSGVSPESLVVPITDPQAEKPKSTVEIIQPDRFQRALREEELSRQPWGSVPDVQESQFFVPHQVKDDAAHIKKMAELLDMPDFGNFPPPARDEVRETFSYTQDCYDNDDEYVEERDSDDY